MKTLSEEKTEVFDSGFKAFLYTNNKTHENSKPEMRLQMKREDLFMNAHYEEKIINIPILAKFSFFDIFDVTDAVSKEIVISEINPKNGVIFLGDDIKKTKVIDISRSSSPLEKIANKLRSNYKLKVKILSANQTENLEFRNNLLCVKYDSSIFSNLPFVVVRDYGNIYELKDMFLKVKTKRKNIQEITLIDKRNVRQFNRTF